MVIDSTKYLVVDKSILMDLRITEIYDKGTSYIIGNNEFIEIIDNGSILPYRKMRDFTTALSKDKKRINLNDIDIVKDRLNARRKRKI